MIPRTVASVAVGLVVWWFFSWVIVASPELESLLSLAFQLVLGLIIGVITYELKPLNAYIIIPITILILMTLTRIVSYNFVLTNFLSVLQLTNFLVNFLIYLPLASIGFFATWAFMQISRVRYA